MQIVAFWQVSPPVQSVLCAHSVHRPLEQWGVAPEQSESERHCAHPCGAHTDNPEPQSSLERHPAQACFCASQVVKFVVHCTLVEHEEHTPLTHCWPEGQGWLEEQLCRASHSPVLALQL